MSFDEMIRALLWVVEHPARGTRILDVPALREASGR